jgi:hypothetical protein
MTDDPVTRADLRYVQNRLEKALYLLEEVNSRLDGRITDSEPHFDRLNYLFAQTVDLENDVFDLIAAARVLRDDIA